VKVGDLVRVVSKEIANYEPYNSKIGLLTKIIVGKEITYYGLLVSGDYRVFRQEIVEDL